MKTESRKRKRYTREERKQQIERAVALKQMQDFKPASLRQIAHRLDMSANGHLMSLLWELVDEQRLVAKPRAHRPNKGAWDFTLPRESFEKVIHEVYEAA